MGSTAEVPGGAAVREPDHGLHLRIAAGVLFALSTIPFSMMNLLLDHLEGDFITSILVARMLYDGSLIGAPCAIALYFYGLFVSRSAARARA
jgi:hypothetical protein